MYDLFFPESAQCEAESRHAVDGDGEREHAGEGGAEQEPRAPQRTQARLNQAVRTHTGRLGFAF